MKKVISLIMVVCVLVSCITCAFASNNMSNLLYYSVLKQMLADGDYLGEPDYISSDRNTDTFFLDIEIEDGQISLVGPEEGCAWFNVDQSMALKLFYYNLALFKEISDSCDLFIGYRITSNDDIGIISSVEEADSLMKAIENIIAN